MLILIQILKEVEVKKVFPFGRGPKIVKMKKKKWGRVGAGKGVRTEYERGKGKGGVLRRRLRRRGCRKGVEV